MRFHTQASQYIHRPKAADSAYSIEPLTRPNKQPIYHVEASLFCYIAALLFKSGYDGAYSPNQLKKKNQKKKTQRILKTTE